jgi:hypothetical protein
VPSKIVWEFGREEVVLPRNVSWAGSGELTIWTDNLAIREYLEGEEIIYLSDGNIEFVPDVWEPTERRVWVYLDDHLAGRLEDRAKEIEFFDFLASYDQKIGVSQLGYVFEEDGKIGVSAKCDVRPVLRIDWDEVRPTAN